MVRADVLLSLAVFCKANQGEKPWVRWGGTEGGELLKTWALV